MLLPLLDPVDPAPAATLGSDSGFGGGVAAGGLAGLLLGTKGGRKMAKKVATYGGIAAVGALAYTAWQKHQQQASGVAPGAATPSPATATAPAPAPAVPPPAMTMSDASANSARTTKETDMARQLVLAFYPSQEEADAAAAMLKESELADGDAIGILVLDDAGKLVEQKVGATSVAAGVGGRIEWSLRLIRAKSVIGMKAALLYRFIPSIWLGL